jgi:hypothetical protein
MRIKKPTTDAHVRFPSELWEAVRVLADQHERSINQEIVWLLREAVKNEQKKQT